MIGERVADPHGVEGGGERGGLGLLPVRTVLAREKVTRAVRVRLRPHAFFGIEPSQNACGALPDPATIEGSGYEIHMGHTTHAPDARVFADLTCDGSVTSDGAVSTDGAIVGTYVHGLFMNDALRWAFVRAARSRAGLAPPEHLVPYAAERDARFDRLAAHVRGSLDVRALLAASMPAVVR